MSPLIKKLSPSPTFLIVFGSIFLLFGLILFAIIHWDEFEFGHFQGGWNLTYDVAFSAFIIGIAFMNLGVRKNTIKKFEVLNRELTKTNEDLLKKAAALEASNKELDDFAYIASHDLKEPLRGIANYSRFILEDYGPNFDEEGKSRLTTLANLPKQMESLINDLLLYSRVGRVDLSVAEVNLNKVLTNVTTLLKPYIDEKNAQIVTPQPLPIVNGDKTRLYDVFQNLIINAIKYNTSASPTVEIGVHNNKGKKITIYVKDNGIGIPKEHHESIFRMFKRLHTRDAYGGGSGAGLTIVKKIIEKHKGKIWIESSEDGSTFFFTLEKSHEE